jgi:DNA-binding transcriptional ArsR family regulator
MLREIFDSPVKEKILLFLLTNGEAYASSIARNFGFNINAVQYQLRKLEDGGVLYSRLEGRTRLFGFSPRFVLKKELLSLLEKAFEYLSEDEKERYYLKRRRPRKAGKPLP